MAKPSLKPVCFTVILVGKAVGFKNVRHLLGSGTDALFAIADLERETPETGTVKGLTLLGPMPQASCVPVHFSN